MKFEHLVQINDPLNPLIDPMTRAELWRGLQYRAENPKEFVLALDSFEILARSADTLSRALHFGRLTVRDHVRLLPEHQVRYEIEPAGEIPGGSLVMTIEEPGEGQLFVRFEYETRAVEGGPPREAYYDEFVKQAYMEADVDSVLTIRRLLSAGKL